MQISILAVGTRMPTWAYSGVDAYSKRMPPHIQVQLAEIPAGKRTAGRDPATAIDKEARQLLKQAESASLTLALDEAGKQWSSADLARELSDWLNHQPSVALLIGGPDGLAESCKQQADRLWSLSNLTLPHGLVRVVLVEQLYRAWTILQGHPYHRS